MALAGIQYKVKAKAAGLKHMLKRCVRVVSTSCKKGWFNVKHIRGRRSVRIKI